LRTLVVIIEKGEAMPVFLRGIRRPGGDAVEVLHEADVPAAAGGLFDAYAYLRDEKANNVAAGSATAATWNTRTLNTKVFDPDNIVSLASNQFTLEPGTYFIEASAPALFSNKSRLRLRDVAAGATVGLGAATYSDPGAVTSSIFASLRCRVTIDVTTTFELQHYVLTGPGFGVDLGTPTNSGETEVYAEVVIRREPAS